MRRVSLPASKRQNGFAVLSLAIAISVVALTIILGYSVIYSKRAALQLSQQQDAYMREVQEAIKQAYMSHAGEVDGFLTHDQYKDINKWFTLAGVTQKWGLQGKVSDVITKDGIGYSVVALWFDAEGDTLNPPAFNEATGVFTSCSNPNAACPDRRWAVVSGYPVQQEKLKRTMAVMNEIALKAETYFKARYAFDPNHNMEINYFRPTTNSCTSPGDEDLPCVDDYTNLGDTGVQEKLAIDNQQLKNAWGYDIKISTKNEANTAEPPYSMVIKSELPWGGEYKLFALQPL